MVLCVQILEDIAIMEVLLLLFRRLRRPAERGDVLEEGRSVQSHLGSDGHHRLLRGRRHLDEPRSADVDLYADGRHVPLHRPRRHGETRLLLFTLVYTYSCHVPLFQLIHI